MINILEIDPVLTVFPYALLYYALLLVSSGLALLSTYRSDRVTNQNLQTALIIIFVSQLLLLTFNLLAYQGFQLVRVLFPLAHRLLNLVCLIWLIWALFRSRDPDFSHLPPIVLTVALLVTGVLFSLWWLPFSSSQDVNHSLIDYILVGFTLVFILISAIVYYTRFRSQVVEAWLILAIAAAGFILYLLLPSPGNMPAAVMLSQIIYYPLLISLAFRVVEPEIELTQPESKPNDFLRANIADAFLEISLQPSQDQLEKALTHSLSLYLMADLLGLVQYEQGSNKATLKNTYDLIREDHVEKVDIATEQMPVLFEKFSQGEPLISNRESELTSEKHYLMTVSGYNQIGNLLLYPLEAIPNQSRWAFLGLSPYTNKVWGLEDIQQLDRLRDTLSRVLQKASRLEQEARQIGDLQAEMLQKESEIGQLRINYAESQVELQGLTNDLHQTQAVWTEEVNLWIERQKELESDLDSLQQTIEENQESLAEVNFLRNQKIQLEATIARNAEKTTQLKTTIDQASLLLQKLTDQEKIEDQAEESKG